MKRIPLSRPSVYSPWTDAYGIRHELAPAGIVLLMTLGLMPLKDAPVPRDSKMGFHVVKRSQSKP